MNEFGDVQIENNRGVRERYEALYEPAAASKRVIEYMVQHPFTDRSVFKAATNLESYVQSYPEVVQLGAVLLDTRTQVERIYGGLQTQTGSSNRKIAEVLFDEAQKKENRRPEGKLEMSYLNNPFALVLVAGGSDFKRLDPRDVAGHYNSSLKVKVLAQGSRVPFIAIKRGSGLSQEEIFIHERNHAFNDMFKKALKITDRSHLWGNGLSDGKERWQVLGDVYSAWELSGEIDKEEAIKSHQAWKRTIDHMLNRAKDEIIVRLMTGETMNSLFERNGFYDYFARDFKLEGNTKIEDLLWNTYLEIIRPEIEIVKSTQGIYRNFGLYDKADTLPWMLMRIPLGSWKNNLNVTGITSETELVRKIIKGRQDTGRTIKGRLRKITSALRSPAEDIAYKSIQNNQEDLLIPELLEYWQNLGKS